MKKLILAPALAIAMSTIAAAPAQAASGEPIFTAGPWSALIGLLLPAVQKSY